MENFIYFQKSRYRYYSQSIHIHIWIISYINTRPLIFNTNWQHSSLHKLDEDPPTTAPTQTKLTAFNTPQTRWQPTNVSTNPKSTWQHSWPYEPHTQPPTPTIPWTNYQQWQLGYSTHRLQHNMEMDSNIFPSNQPLLKTPTTQNTDRCWIWRTSSYTYSYQTQFFNTKTNTSISNSYSMMVSKVRQ